MTAQSAPTGSPTDARVLCWSALPTDTPMAHITRQRVIGEKAMISRVILEPGFKVDTHSHANEQITCVVSGRTRFVLHEGTSSEWTCTLGAGEILMLPANVPHSAEALERTEIWDIFAPPSATTGVDAGHR